MPTSVLLNALAAGVSGTPAVRSALLAVCGSGLALAVDHYSACAAAHTDLSERAVGLINRREWHSLCGGGDSQSEQSKRYCFEHGFLPAMFQFCVVRQDSRGPASLNNPNFATSDDVRWQRRRPMGTTITGPGISPSHNAKSWMNSQ